MSRAMFVPIENIAENFLTETSRTHCFAILPPESSKQTEQKKKKERKKGKEKIYDDIETRTDVAKRSDNPWEITLPLFCATNEWFQKISIPHPRKGFFI